VIVAGCSFGNSLPHARKDRANLASSTVEASVLVAQALKKNLITSEI